MQSLMDPVVDFDEDERRNHNGLSCLLDQLPATAVCGVITVQGRVQRASVQDQRHERGCGRSSPACGLYVFQDQGINALASILASYAGARVLRFRAYGRELRGSRPARPAQRL